MKHMPFSSPLLPHIELIRSMRRGHKTWKQISVFLDQRKGVKSDYRTIQNFFKRWHDRQNEMPLGWEKMVPERTFLSKIERV
jgi:hypothetical protein